MVERPGMGPEKLDATCYLYEALHGLANMATVLAKETEAQKYRNLAEDIKARFDVDWWLEQESLFADSLRDDNSKQLDGHWTVAVPMATGIANRDKGLRALKRIEREWVNEFGLVHTKDVEEKVWTLPTGILAKAEFNYGNVDMGVRLAKNIAQTIQYGMLGAYEELIPHGLCFVQLWSSALFLENAIEGLFGIAPVASQHYVELFPKLPKGWTFAEVTNLDVGGQHKLSISHHEVYDEGESKTVISHLANEHYALRCMLSLFVKSKQPKVLLDERELSAYILENGDDERDILRLGFTIEPNQTIVVVVK